MQHIQAAIQNFLKKSGLNSGVEQQKALKLWGEIVGDSISKNTEPVSVKNGTLVIKTTNPVWKQELQIQKAEIIKKLNYRLKKNIIKEIRFK
jgi:predicted nucleic acid-binding Zn ribbon protein